MLRIWDHLIRKQKHHENYFASNPIYPLPKSPRRLYMVDIHSLLDISLFHSPFLSLSLSLSLILSLRQEDDRRSRVNNKKSGNYVIDHGRVWLLHNVRRTLSYTVVPRTVCDVQYTT